MAPLESTYVDVGLGSTLARGHSITVPPAYTGPDLVSQATREEKANSLPRRRPTAELLPERGSHTSSFRGRYVMPNPRQRREARDELATIPLREVVRMLQPVWFYPSMSRPVAEKHLALGPLGSFVARRSHRQNGYGLVVKTSSSTFWHGLIVETENGLQLPGQRRLFPDLVELITHCVSGMVPQERLGLPCPLLLPGGKQPPHVKRRMARRRDSSSDVLLPGAPSEEDHDLLEVDAREAATMVSQLPGSRYRAEDISFSTVEAAAFTDGSDEGEEELVAAELPGTTRPVRAPPRRRSTRRAVLLGEDSV